MNDQKLRRISAMAAFLFVFFCLLWVALSYIVLPFASGQKDYSMLILDSEWTLVALSGLLSSLFGIFAVFGIFHANREKGGMLLFIGIVLLVTGIAFEWAGLTWDIFIWPVVCTYEQYISFVREGLIFGSPQFTAFFIAMLVFLFSGNILTAIGLLKAGKWGKLIPILLITGILLYGIGNLVLIYLATLGLCIYCLAFILIGIQLWKE